MVRQRRIQNSGTRQATRNLRDIVETDGLTFPMVWARNDESVAAVNVTERYSKGDRKIIPWSN